MDPRTVEIGMFRSQLQKLMSAPEWATLQLLAEKLKERYRTGTKKGASEFDTIWRLAHSEGAIEGIDSLLQEAFTEASKLNESYE